MFGIIRLSVGCASGKPKDGCPHFSPSGDEHIITVIRRQSPDIALFKNSFDPRLVLVSYSLYNEMVVEPLSPNR
jgi:hypothetical protein